MKVHNYHPISHVYLGTTDADLDELESTVQGNEVWMLPAHASFTEPPPIPEGMVAVHKEDDTWELILASDAPAEDGSAPPTFEQQQQAFMRLVDSDVDNVYFQVIGNRAQEYLMAEAEARAYLDALGAGGPDPVVGDSIIADMLAHVRTAEEASQVILQMAEAWRSACVVMRTARLIAKANAMKTANAQDLASLALQWQEDMAGVRQNLGV